MQHHVISILVHLECPMHWTPQPKGATFVYLHPVGPSLRKEAQDSSKALDEAKRLIVSFFYGTKRKAILGVSGCQPVTHFWKGLSEAGQASKSRNQVPFTQPNSRTLLSGHGRKKKCIINSTMTLQHLTLEEITSI